MTTDQLLLLQLKSSEVSAMDFLFKTHYEELCRTAFRILADRAAAEDIVQEVFLEIWRSRARLQLTGSFGAYLRRATVNRSLNYLRDRRMIVTDTDESDADLSAAVESPVFDIETLELQEAIERAIDALPIRCRQVFILNRFEELSAREIAEILGISIKTVENQMTKALKVLRFLLRDRL